jgi:hypothetical protein
MGALAIAVDFVIVVADRKKVATTIGLADSLPQTANPIELRGHDEDIEERLANNPRCRRTLSRLDGQWKGCQQFVNPRCRVICC